MKIHEYQAKELFRKYNVPVPEGEPVFSIDEAQTAAGKLGGFPVVVKAQIHAGGRGKGGGVKLAHSMEEVEALADEILGMTLVTHQTGPEGKLVQKLLIEAGARYRKGALPLPSWWTGQRLALLSWPVRTAVWTLRRWRPKPPERIIKVQVDPLMGIQGLPA